ncbi:MAG: DEAD/DEAH box helicase [Candidatus Eremiobacteraeota bacterium]|nr:DEAD/DEAH box helicase [Candidatus Eremiobacteraeota bacterium]
MNVFEFRDQLIKDFSSYINSFIEIKDERIATKVENWLHNGILWPEPLIHLNPFFEPGHSMDELVSNDTLHPECSRIFSIKKGTPLRLHKHQDDALMAAKNGANYILTTGTGSGKSLAYIVPIVDHVLRNGSGKGIQAIIVYPMNALVNSQFGELEKFLCRDFEGKKAPVTFRKYTGQEKEREKHAIISNPPDILLTNYVMLELILTRPFESGLVSAAQGLKFLVLDELHTYRGRQGADVAMLTRRLRDACNARELQCVGTSATLAGSGSFDEQKTEVARVATQLFGDTVESKNVIGETLRRITPLHDSYDSDFISSLTRIISSDGDLASKSFEKFIQSPLSTWIEDTFGIVKASGSGRLIRSNPISIGGENGAAKKLSELTKEPEEKCEKRIQDALLLGYSIQNPQTERPIFAFRLHQFISSGDRVYASLEPENQRYITIFGQRFVPNEDRQKILLPLTFCRECGQEYYCVRMKHNNQGETFFDARNLSDTKKDEEGEPGFLYLSFANPWPEDGNGVIERLPEGWVEEEKGKLRVKRDSRRFVPRSIRVKSNGFECAGGLEYQFFTAPFRFCLNCGVAYGGRQRSDFGKLTTLGNEGRSTATTILSLSSIRYLRDQIRLSKKARKLLSFTDNRQDASLQAGHFNDFIQVSLLRAALYKAMKEAGTEGISHEVLAQKVFKSLNFPLERYARDAEVRFAALNDTQKAFRQVIGYRLYRDLRRGWRVTSPNLEQCGLLKVIYKSIDELCEAQDVWQDLHPSLSTASSKTRKKIAITLLDYMRRELAIKVDYLNREFQEQIKRNSDQRLISPWAIDENEKLEYATVMFPRSRRKGKDSRENRYISPRGGFGQFIRRRSTLENYDEKITLDETGIIIGDLLEALRAAGLVEIVSDPGNENDVPGYKIPASAMIWAAGEGAMGFHDPIRVPNQSELGVRTNQFFVDFYISIALGLVGFKAREHTAQVPSDERIKREKAFREGNLPILYCSPTMELGVDISELNAVNMRNIPPTPANYAQRSGRAGRSGQPALVFTYCSTGSPHDQHFFKRPALMVAGSVTPPRLDLANEDLVRSHVQAIWLTETGMWLGSSLKDILNLPPESLNFELNDSVVNDINRKATLQRTLSKARRTLRSISNELNQSDWYNDEWLQKAIQSIPRRFDKACDRWRGLYIAAMTQRDLQHQIICDASRPQNEKENAKRLRREAEAQLELLEDSSSAVRSDFYSYRYFASEGFLPGYNFPRLPLSAYIPGRRTNNGRDEFLSRPRFLAISEFGPNSIIYHEGSKYVISKVILPVGRDENIRTNLAKLCSNCGYFHSMSDDVGPDLCEFCEKPLGQPIRQLFRLQNVSTRRRERINSDEEERSRIGYEIKTAIRFAEYGGKHSCRTSTIKDGDEVLGYLTYGSTASIWRINFGGKRRSKKEQFGFILDTESGYWKSDKDDVEDGNNNEPVSSSLARVIPFVEDRRNCLLFKPEVNLDISQMASLQSALKNAIQVEFQLEENELAAEPLPDDKVRRVLIFYESAEGGAGVLRHLLDDSHAFGEVAKKALEICHFDSETGEDLKRAPQSIEDCEAACYDCLMSYRNQREHDLLDRKAIKSFLMRLAQAKAESSPAELSRQEHFRRLMNLSTTNLEKRWLGWLEENEFNLPSDAQVYIERCKTRPDFEYKRQNAVIYVDGPHHDYPDRQERDMEQVECLEDYGYTVIRFKHDGDWQIIAEQYPNIFGRGT